MSSDDDDNDENDSDCKTQVYVRLRPMNKLEASRRSKNCIELHDDPKVMTVDAPLQGMYDFTCDMIFDEVASQAEVFNEAVSKIPQKVLSGINCTLLAYGQTGTGKTHTMLGQHQGMEFTAHARSRRRESSNNSQSPVEEKNEEEDSIYSNINPIETEGMIPRAAAALFRLIQTQQQQQHQHQHQQRSNNDSSSDSPFIEYTIRCSFVEIYLERVCDLLQPFREGIRIGTDENGDSCIINASELCCIDIDDIYTVLARGNAYRTKAATNQVIDSNRSTIVVTIKVDQINRDTNTQCTSRLQMIELAGSEYGRIQSSTSRSKKDTGAISQESKMINQSLTCMTNMIRSRLAQQQKNNNKNQVDGGNGVERCRVTPDAFANSSKLAKLLLPSFGGNSYTTVICTASPSSYNISETLNTIRFAQRVQKIRNEPKPNKHITFQNCRTRLTRSEKQVNKMNQLVLSLANECQQLLHRLNTNKNRDEEKEEEVPVRPNNQLWDVIRKLTKLNGGQARDMFNDDNIHIDIDVSVTKNRNSNTNSVSYNSEGEEKANDDDEFYNSKTFLRRRIEELERQLQESRIKHEKVENAFRDIQSDLISLRSQNEVLIKEKEKLECDVRDAKAESRTLSTKKIELEHNFRTSRFREKEAITFIRQFRNFYFRLVQTKTARSNGDTKDVMVNYIKKIPGVPELSQLVDIDRLLVASGLLEKNEVGRNTKIQNYIPSKEAETRSANQAAVADKKEKQIIEKLVKDGSNDNTLLSVVTRQESGQESSFRYKLIVTPAGRLAMHQEKQLEREMLELSKKCINLQNAINTEKNTVETLSSRQGAINKLKTSQMINALKSEVERKSNDYQMIVWKMNELHLVNKSLEEKVGHREQHITYLEEHLVDLQTRNRRLVIERQEAEKKLREECSIMKKQLDGLTVSIWQLDDGNSTNSNDGEKDNEKHTHHNHKSKNEERTLPLPWKRRLILPFTPNVIGDDRKLDDDEQEQKRRQSIGEIIEEFDFPIYPDLVDVSTQTEDDDHTDATSTITTMTNSTKSSRDHSQKEEDEKERGEAESSAAAESSSKVNEESVVNETKLSNIKNVETQTTESSRLQSMTIDSSTQTEGKYKLEVESIDSSVQTEDEAKVDSSVQTEEVTKVASIDSAVQTEEEPKPICIDSAVQTEKETKEMSTDAQIQTDETKLMSADVEIQTEETKVESNDAAIQTEATTVESKDVAIQAGEEPKAMFTNSTITTEEEPQVACTDVAIQTEMAETVKNISTNQLEEMKDLASDKLEPKSIATQTDGESKLKVDLTETSAQTEKHISSEISTQTDITIVPDGELKLPANTTEVFTQTESSTIDKLETSTQTEDTMLSERVSETTSTVLPEGGLKSTVDTAEMCTQTEPSEVVEPSPRLDFMVQTDDQSLLNVLETKPLTSGITETVAQTEQNHAANVGVSVGIQTDGLPQVVAVGESSLLGSNSLDDLGASNHLVSKASIDFGSSSMSWDSETGKPPRHMKPSENNLQQHQPQIDEGNCLPEVERPTRRQSYSAPATHFTTHDQPVIASASFSPGRTDWLSKRRTPSVKPGLPKVPFLQSARSSSPLPYGSPPVPKYNHKRGKESGRTDVDDPDLPEWMNKFRQMGIKTDENDDEHNSHRASWGGGAGRRRSTSDIKLQKRRSFPMPPSPTPYESPIRTAGSIGVGIEHRRQKFTGTNSDLAVPHTMSPITNKKISLPKKVFLTPEQRSPARVTAAKSNASSQPEWMQQFKKIGMKDESHVEGRRKSGSTIASRKHEKPDVAKYSPSMYASPHEPVSSRNSKVLSHSNIPAPDVAKYSPAMYASPHGSISSRNSKVLSHSNVPAPPPFDEPSTSENLTTTASGDAAEWMLKFNEIGQKGEEQITLIDDVADLFEGGKPADYKPRRFVDKFGSSIKPGVTQDNTMNVDENKTRTRMTTPKKNEKLFINEKIKAGVTQDNTMNVDENKKTRTQMMAPSTRNDKILKKMERKAFKKAAKFAQGRSN